MILIEVADSVSSKMFFELPAQLYRNNSEYIAPLLKDVEAVFDPKRNRFHQHGEVKRWIVVDHKQQPAGRIAAFINSKY